MRMAVLSLLLAASACPAAASGGIGCTVEDEAVTLSIDGGISRGMGSALFALSGSIQIRDEAVAADLAALDFAREHVPQYWLDGSALKLRLYREREAAPHGYVEIAVDAMPVGDGYAGDYAVTVYDDGAQASFAGAVSCFVE